MTHRAGMTLSHNRTQWQRMLMGATALTVLSITAMPHALAQETTGASEGSSADIIVTGSRIARRDMTADSPIVTVSEAVLEAAATTALEDKLNAMPQFTPGNTRFASGSDQSGQATLNLRALGDFRTLTLVDGRRPQPGNARVTFDLNTIPSNIIGNVEVISGGASAVYGSDAVAGVVNLRTRKDFTGVELNASTSITERGDGAERQIGILMGSDFADDRGHAMLAFEYTDRNAIYQKNRKFYDASYQSGTGILASPYLLEGYYVPNTLNPADQSVLNSVFAGYGITGQDIFGNLGFNSDGTLFTVGGGGLNYKGALFPQNALTSYGSLVYNSGYPQLLSVPMERYAVFGSFDYKLTDAITAYAQFNYADYKTVTNTAAAPADGLWGINVPRDADHPVPDGLAAILDSRADPTAPFQIGKRLGNVGDITVEHTNQVYQILLGAKGDLGVGDLKWDLYGSYGKSQLADNYVGGAVMYSRLQELVSRPNYGAGTSIDGMTCTSGVQLFGNVPMSQDCINVLTAQLKRTTEVEQKVVEGLVSGSLAELPAGPLGFALGASYRKNTYKFTPDALAASSSTSNIVGVFGSEPTQGSTSVTELFAEALIPVFRDSAIGKSFELNLAYRFSDYDTVGSVHTYKASGNWEVNDALRLRGGYQRAIRAPNVAELYSGRSMSITLWTDLDPCGISTQAPYGNVASNPNQAQVRELCIAMGVPRAGIEGGVYDYNTPIALGEPVGNPNVREETADTYNIGIVFSPKIGGFVNRFSLSVDAYRINIKDAIGYQTPAQIYARCFNATGENPTYSADNQFCQVIGRDDGSTTVSGIPSGIPTITELPYMNLGGYKTQGIDFQIDTSFALGERVALNLNSNITYLDKFEVQTAPGEAYLDYAGTIGYTITGNGTFAKWSATTIASLSFGDANIGMRWRWIDSMRYYTNVAIPGDATPGTRAYSNFDLFGSINVNDRYTFRFGVDNVTDKQPLVVGGVAGSTDPTIYDPIGRRFYAGIRAKF